MSKYIFATEKRCILFEVRFEFLNIREIFTLKMKAIRSSETWRHMPEYGILQSHRRENLKSYSFIFPHKIV
jgi:hypothetical protein